MKKRNSVLLVLLSVAGASIFALTRGESPETNIPPVLTEEPVIANPAAPNPCAYTWAYQDLPEISAEFNADVQALVPEAEARATAFGEDCVSADGRAVSFAEMETDFYVIIQVSDLNDNEALGTLIEKILPILDGFTSPRVPGAKEGFVEFTFQNSEEQRVIRVPIPLGRALRERGLHGAELIGAIEQ